MFSNLGWPQVLHPGVVRGERATPREAAAGWRLAAAGWRLAAAGWRLAGLAD